MVLPGYNCIIVLYFQGLLFQERPRLLLQLTRSRDFENNLSRRKLRKITMLQCKLFVVSSQYKYNAFETIKHHGCISAEGHLTFQRERTTDDNSSQKYVRHLRNPRNDLECKLQTYTSRRIHLRRAYGK
jgi:hypothetical protein